MKSRVNHEAFRAIIVGIRPMEDFYISGASVKLFLPIVTMNFRRSWTRAAGGGVFHNLVFVSTKKIYPMEAYKFMQASGAWGR